MAEDPEILKARQALVEHAELEVKRKRAIQVRRAQIRALAMTVYISNPEWRVQDLPLKDTRFLTVPLSDLEKWAVKDKWDHKRKDVETRHFEKLRTILANKYTENKLREAQQLEAVATKAQAYLEGDDLKPRSYEGLVKARLALSQRIEDIHGQMAGEVVKATDPLADLELQEDEQSQVAKFLLDLRRKKGVLGEGKKPEDAEKLGTSKDEPSDDDEDEDEDDELEEDENPVELEADSDFLEDLNKMD